MHPLLRSQQPLYMEGVGPLRLSYDYVELCSGFSTEYLERNLPLDELRAASHRFVIKPINYSPRYSSKIRITGTGNGNPFWIFYLSEECLGDYAITHVEIAAELGGNQSGRGGIQAASRDRADVQATSPPWPPSGCIRGSATPSRSRAAARPDGLFRGPQVDDAVKALRSKRQTS